MIFRILEIKRTINEAREEPNQFFSGGIKNVLKSFLLRPLISTLLLLSIFFVLGFTSLLGGPFGLAKFLFFILLLLILSVFFILIKLYKIFKNTSNLVNESTDEPIKVKSKIVE